MFEPIRRWPRFVKALIICCFVGALGTLIAAKTLRKESLYEAANRYQRCLEEQDSQCLYQFASESERKQLGLTEANFGKFASRIIFPHLKGMKRQGEPNMMSLDGDPKLISTGGPRALYAENADPGASRIAVVQRYKNPAGKIDSLEFELTDTPQGPRSSGLVGALYLTSVSAFAPKDQVRQWKRYRYWSSQTKAHLAELQSSGVKGYVANALRQSSDPVSWEQWIHYWDTDFNHRQAVKPMMSDKAPGMRSR